MKAIPLIFIFIQHYLLMGPIQSSIESGNYGSFEKICLRDISVNLESPLQVKGYFPSSEFINNFSKKMENYKVPELEWISKHIWENFAVQSLNIVLKSIRSGNNIYYKLIFFMKRDKQEWKLYYLRGIKL
ncbi:MAG: hypothetical protein ABFR75_13325 [Acidobacteriota bacterium]